MAETPNERFNRDWGQIEDDRRERGLDYQSQERVDRLYVMPNGSTLADDENKFGEVFDPEA